MILESGELDQRVTIEKRTTKRSDSGAIMDGWYDMGTYWAKLKPVTHKNLEVAKGFAATVEFELVLRHRPDLDNDCRVEIGQKKFAVNGVIHDTSPQRLYTQAFLSLINGG